MNTIHWTTMFANLEIKIAGRIPAIKALSHTDLTLQETHSSTRVLILCLPRDAQLQKYIIQSQREVRRVPIVHQPRPESFA